MTGSTGKPNPLDKRKIYVFIMAGIVAGLSPVLMGIDRLYIRYWQGLVSWQVFWYTSTIGWLSLTPCYYPWCFRTCSL